MYSLLVFVFLSFYIHGSTSTMFVRDEGPDVMPPRPPIDSCSGERSNQLNEKCSDEKDCYYGLRCIDGVCKCGENQIEVSNKIDKFFRGPEAKPYCRNAPRYNQRCETVCQKPMECVRRRCKCPEGLEYKNGICFKECDKDEFFAVKQGVCLKHCSENQIKINATCFELGALGEKCESNRQCNTGFSWCQNGVCACKSGFTKQGDICETNSYKCPYGEPLTGEDGKVQECEQTEGSGMSDFPEIALYRKANGGGDNCPEKYRCVNYPGAHPSGHCCPKPNHGCIVGEPLADVTCDYRKKQEGVTFCPHDSHTCSYNYDGENIDCCPRACGPHDSIFKDGKCYPSVKLGEKCFWDEQCRMHTGVCIDGKCECGENAKRNNGYGGHRYCTIVCKLTEFQYGSKCYPKKKIGEDCSRDMTCPHGAKCSKGKCECRCKHTQYGDYLCLKEDSLKCPSFGDWTNDTGSEPEETNPTFCTRKHSNVRSNDDVITVVDDCPDDQFCHAGSYIPGNLALCCPKPELECPRGAEVVHTNCTQRDYESCQGGYCHRMYHPADHESNEGYVCCQHRPPPPRPETGWSTKIKDFFNF